MLLLYEFVERIRRTPTNHIYTADHRLHMNVKSILVLGLLSQNDMSCAANMY